jgi:transcriptional regulator with XRE-family HTH domain
MTPETLRAFREGLGLTQDEFAERLGLASGRKQIYSWESGRAAPSQTSISRIIQLAYNIRLVNPPLSQCYQLISALDEMGMVRSESPIDLAHAMTQAGERTIGQLNQPVAVQTINEA